MATRNVSMTVTFVAWDTSANTGKIDDQSNIAVKWIKDGTVETLDTNTVTQVDSTNCPGIYKVTISAAEANCNIGTLAGKSTTSNIVVLPITIQFERLPDAAPAANGGLPTVDASNHINGIQYTLSVNVTQIEGSDATDQINAACDAAIETYGLDHLVAASVAGSDIVDNSIIAKLVSKESTADWDDYVNTTDSLQAQKDAMDVLWTTDIVEAYAGPTETACTPAQLLYMIFSCVGSYTISSDKIITYDLPGSGSMAQAMRFDMDSTSSPTYRKRDA